MWKRVHRRGGCYFLGLWLTINVTFSRCFAFLGLFIVLKLDSALVVRMRWSLLVSAALLVVDSDFYCFSEWIEKMRAYHSIEKLCKAPSIVPFDASIPEQLVSTVRAPTTGRHDRARLFQILSLNNTVKLTGRTPLPRPRGSTADPRTTDSLRLSRKWAGSMTGGQRYLNRFAPESRLSKSLRAIRHKLTAFPSRSDNLSARKTLRQTEQSTKNGRH